MRRSTVRDTGAREDDVTAMARSTHFSLFTVMAELRRFHVKTSTLTLTQYAILGHLADQGPIRTMRLAEMEGVRGPTMLTRIDRLETLGLVKRQRSERDNRVVTVALTPKGVDVHRDFTDDMLTEMLGELTAAEFQELKTALVPLERLVERWRNER